MTRCSWLATCSFVLTWAGVASAQPFASGSDGSAGALTFTGSGTKTIDGTVLDPDQDGVFHFTTIDIPSGITLRMTTAHAGFAEGRPVIFLASGDVTIAGKIDVRGSKGPDRGNYTPWEVSAGAGGFRGGRGALDDRGSDYPTTGRGPGGGKGAPDKQGGNASHRTSGGGGTGNQASPGATYGNKYCLPLIGGSGGGGGTTDAGSSNSGPGGGGGGGAILIASTTKITLTGTIDARGGDRGRYGAYAGYGSGGAIRLVAPTITSSGTRTLDVRNGASSSSSGVGRVRLEARVHQGTPTVHPDSSRSTRASLPNPASFLPPANPPRITVTAVDGQAVVNPPTSSFATPDVIISNGGAVTLSISARNVPVGTTVTIVLNPEDGPSQTITSSPLTGSTASSTATAGPVTIPSGLARFMVFGKWSAP